MRNLILTFFVLFALQATAQKKTGLNGENVYVYPFQQQVEYSRRNFLMDITHEEIITRDSFNRDIVSAEILPVGNRMPMDNSPGFKKTKKIFIEARQKAPHVLYRYNLPLEEDLVPVMETLPDGKYVQFYRDLPYVDNRQLRYKNDVVCAVFSLKNNQLEGPACWFSPSGDTVKFGRFENGLKEGEWHGRDYDINPFGDEITIEKINKGVYTDTFFVDVNYKNGLLDGPYSSRRNTYPNETGNYINGKASGEWKHYERKSIREGIVTRILNEVVLVRHYTIADSVRKGTKPVIRNSIIPREVDRVKYDVPYDSRFYPFSNYYVFYKEPEEEGLELPEEKVNSYPGEPERYEYDLESLEAVNFEYADHKTTYVFGNKEYTRNDILDSVGYMFEYEGVYEEFYRNGQLKLRFEIRNGQMVKEDTIYYDNGSPANYITFDGDKKEYHEHILDFNGQPITELIYNEKGNFSRLAEGAELTSLFTIRGKQYESREYDQTYKYYSEDTLLKPLSGKVVIGEELWKFDSTVAQVETFDPVTATLRQVNYSLAGKERETFDLNFTENYEVVRGINVITVDDFQSRTTLSGSYYRFPLSVDTNTVASSRVHQWYQKFDTQYDNVLYYKDQPYTGKFSVTTHAGKFGISSGSDNLHINIGSGKKQTRALQKMLRNAYHHRKLPALADYADNSVGLYGEFGETVLYDLAPFISEVYEPVFSDFFESYSEYDDKSKVLSESRAPAFDKKIAGQFSNGKPSGVWMVYDQFGKVTARIPFLNGEMEGTVLHYATAEPEVEYSYYDEYMEEKNPLLKDTFPEKKTRYLQRVSNYKDGLLNGPFYEFNWLGDTMQAMNFELGALQGTTIERSKIAYSIAGYDQGLLDGISQTYLTLPGKDTILLFDLNFQDGRLQGESKSYHMSGKLAKHGFFLGGQPIDDYEAFDTLGFRYQYVKFQFNQPVEEKIWEENALSVRYTFDWRDSVFFESQSIAGSESLERTLMEYGIYSEYDIPYYGRPSVLNKNGVNYHMTKYYPNDTIARDGEITKGKKTGCWKFYSYEGLPLSEVDYFDTIIAVDGVRFKSKGILTQLDEKGDETARSYIVEKVEKYDCSHTDHHEVRMLITIWERDSSVHRMNGYVKNYYDNGVLQNEGYVKNGVATGVWKFYDPYGSLNKVGEYLKGKRNGRWLSGDLSKVKYMGDICLNPNLPNLDEILSYEEKLLDISVIHYQKGIVRKREYYGVNMNTAGPPENYYEEGY